MNTKKGASPLITGILIIALSVAVMVFVLSVAIPFFNNLSDSMKYDQNKKNILDINSKLLDLKNRDINSSIIISINLANDMEFNDLENKIIIRQEIKNNSNISKYSKDENINNLNISKKNNFIIFSLDLNGIVDLNQSLTLNNKKEQLNFIIVDKKNNISVIDVTRVSTATVKIYINGENLFFLNEHKIIVTTIPTDSVIYYTTDGSEPNEESIEYTEPIVINDTSNFKFKAYRFGLEPSKTITGNYIKIYFNTLFFNNFTTNQPLLDLSENNNSVSSNNVIFNQEGAYFDNNPDSYISIENDWNNSHPELNLGIKNFTLETFISKDYIGSIFSKRGFVGALDLRINSEDRLELNFSGADQFFSVFGLATDENYIYISDAETHSVQKRDKYTWELLLVSGGPRATSAIDGYNTPYGVAVDDEFIYISDNVNCRIVKRYKSDFSFHSMLSNGCGSADNQVRYNWGIAVDDEFIYVSETTYHRIKKFRKDTFEFVAKLGGGSTGVASGNTNITFNNPRGIAVYGDFLYVADTSNQKLKKYNKSNFSFVSLIGSSSGSGDEQLYEPYDVSVTNDYVYIADYRNNRIMIRNNDYTMSYFNKIASTGPDFEQIYFTNSIASDDNFIFLSENTSSRIKKYNVNTLEFIENFSDMNPGKEGMYKPFGIANDGEYLYYTDIGLHRVVKRRISDMEVVNTIGGPYPLSGNYYFNFNTPYGLTIKENRLFVIDSTNNRIKVYDKDTFSYLFACYPGTNVFRTPVGITYDENYFYVTTIYNTLDSLLKIKMTENSCSVEQNIGGPAGTGDDQFNDPYAVAVDDTYVYVLDQLNYRIKKHLKSDLSFVSDLGIGTSQQYPYGIASAYNMILHDGYLYISDNGYTKISKYTTDFEYVSHIGFHSGASNRTFIAPRGMTIVGDDMYIVDQTLARITKRSLSEFDVDANYIGNNANSTDFFSSFSADSDDEYYYIANYLVNRLEKRKKSDFTLVAYLGGPNAISATSNQITRRKVFYGPNDVVVDGEFVYVSDNTNHRLIRYYKEDLRYDMQFGDGSAGSTTTRLYNPRQIFINDSNIYIANYGSGKIVILDKTDMSYITSFGTTGTGVNQFSSVTGVAVDDNYIYTAEYGSHRIKKIDKNTFAYVAHLGGSAGNATNQFKNPYYITLDENYIYIADSGNHRVKKHNKSDLSYVAMVGSTGFGDDNFRTPYSVKYKDENTLLVSDYTNRRIHIRDPADLSLKSMIDPSPVTFDRLEGSFGLAIDENYIYISDDVYNRVLKKDKKTFETVGSIGGPFSGSTESTFNNPKGLAVDDNFLYVADNTNQRILKYNKTDLSWVYTYSPGTQVIRQPIGVAVDGKYLYVTSNYGSTTAWITKIDMSNENAWVVTKETEQMAGVGDNQFVTPRGITVSGDYIYIADSLNHRIHKRNKDDLSLVELYGIGAPYSAASYGVIATNSFNTPYGIFAYDGLLYITDYGNNRVKIFDVNFNYITTFGKLGYGPDQMSSPTDVAVDEENIYISDYANHRIIIRKKTDIDNMVNTSFTNFIGTYALNINKFTSEKAITTDSQIILKRSGNEFCFYINGKKDACKDYSTTPTSFTFPEVNTRYGITSTDFYISENQNHFPYVIGAFGLTTPGKGYIKYLRIFDTNLSDQDIEALYNLEIEK